jgi:flagellar hook assembly protein FlgD
LTIYNIAGQTIRTLVDEPQLAGYHSILWDGCDASGNEVASGIYIYRFSARSNEAAFATVKKMTLLR